jgi:hypothetical protein
MQLEVVARAIAAIAASVVVVQPDLSVLDPM